MEQIFRDRARRYTNETELVIMRNYNLKAKVCILNHHGKKKLFVWINYSGGVEFKVEEGNAFIKKSKKKRKVAENQERKKKMESECKKKIAQKRRGELKKHTRNRKGRVRKWELKQTKGHFNAGWQTVRWACKRKRLANSILPRVLDCGCIWTVKQ